MKLYIFPLMICALFVFAGCQPKANDQLEVTTISSSGPTPTEPPSRFKPIEDDNRPKLVPDPLSGLPVTEDVASSRPFAVIINNHTKARPQSGLAQASIIYEALAEGNITRMLAVFHYFDTQKIGPIRSARDYYIDFALDYDAVFVHHGGSPQAYDMLDELGIAELDGMSLARTFWRDPKRVQIPGMYEHSSYSGHDLMVEAAAGKGFRTTTDKAVGFMFYGELTELADASPATYVSVPFAEAYGVSFEYRDNLYYKFIDGEPQIDAETGLQLAAANVIIQYANINLIAGDSAGRREVDIIGSGDATLITAGGYANINWEKADHFAHTRWTHQNGQEIVLNMGLTWICVVSPTTPTEIS
jgi:hypothetical protein